MDIWFRLRLQGFLFQHLFSTAMMVHRKLKDSYYDEPIPHMKWIVAITGVNFLAFAGIELYCLTKLSALRLEENPQVLLNTPVVILSYFHLYYQFNVYIGIFFLFSLIMCAVYCINERGRTEQLNEVK